MTDEQIKTAAEAVEAEALAHLREVHTDPDQETPSVPKTLAADGKSPARWAYERLILYIQNFEAQLDPDHEVAMAFVGGDAGVLRIEGMGYFDPDIVTFYGSTPSGAKTQLIQHVSQLSVMLRTLPKSAETGSPNRIGFKLAKGLEEQSS